MKKTKANSRRDFLKASAIAGAGAMLSPHLLANKNLLSRRRRYALVGTGSRARTFQRAVQSTYSETCELVGLCDLNPGRLELARQRSTDYEAPIPPGYLHRDFERMIRETRPDFIIVTTMDSTHDDYIIRALEAGCDVITEKPMTTEQSKVLRIQEAVARTGKTVRVCFNYRYSPARTQIKDLLMSGKIGDVLSVDFQWLLNTQHGADYFRRWHGEKKNSGGLMVHKSTHHFDLVNWWLGSNPSSVTAVGKREFYTPEMAKRLGLESYHERCQTCPEANKCSFHLDLAKSSTHRKLYLEQEHHDGYYRDRCVFNPRIDIEDTMNVIVQYDNKVTLSYSLNAFNSWEGYQIAFNGTQGRIEHSIVEKVYVNGTGTEQGGIAKGGITTRYIPLRGAAEDIMPWDSSGGHGGGDKVMLDDLFLDSPLADPYLRASDDRGGAASVLIGSAANECFRSGQPVHIDTFAQGWKKPRYAPMPDRSFPISMPPAIG
ncbi:Gfo/Idh/MocA family oxidoreductase [Pelagicoccus enzymogenes]|uniref:Gfo/Idh/MocA family oxidoreductase n=1 Tax=Pelagicoccus enzymogenes TaxID=2773457 RepID=UPI00280F8D8E|nr:Gfo/Idh/MocA family oxidoreductase [Pelagicoccus enzymogenes]MDQ8199399.1 Gfo/Idh/MocA family oxidoreductase [Pelagicoccus enzymogenes]